MHTIKNNLITTENQSIVHLSLTDQGTVHFRFCSPLRKYKSNFKWAYQSLLE
jgi:hypothetical protein